MKILFAHNFYQVPGGEESVFRAEVALLRSRGHDVVTYTEDNAKIDEMSRLELARTTLWSDSSFSKLTDLIKQEAPQVVHFHNTFPLISPAAYYAAAEEGVPVIQTLHNYRLLCPNALFFRDGHVCEDCLGKAIPWPGIRHSCYRKSRAASVVVAGMLAYHRFRDTWRDMVDRYIVLSEFARDKFITGGLPEDKLVIKPNFVQRGIEMGPGDGGYAFFAGRLSTEKGLQVMLKAWETIGSSVPLKIAGDGPEANLVAEAVARNPNIEWLGLQTPDEVLHHMQRARCLIFPSVWYEGLPMVIIEAFAAGLPVIASNLGGMKSIFEHEVSGLHFPPGDVDGLIFCVKRIVRDNVLYNRVRQGARNKFDLNYTADRNYEMLMEIYESVQR